jgi:carbonic anhydrase
MTTPHSHGPLCGCLDRRGIFVRAAGLAGLAAAGGALLSTRPAAAQALTRAQRDAMTPDDVIEMMKRGNARFRAGERKERDWLAQQRATAAGQYPAAVLLSCIDSRAPAEVVLDLGIGDVFNSRIAGNVADVAVLGGMEFACKLAGAKVVLVMGHTACGAVAGAIAGAQLGNLTALLAKIAPAIPATSFSGERSATNAAYVDAVARTNVGLTVAGIRRESPVLAEMERAGQIRIAGAMYDLATGAVEFLG